jgi:hypothetical protein
MKLTEQTTHRKTATDDSSLLMNTTQMEMLFRLENNFLDESLDLLEDIFGEEELTIDDRTLDELLLARTR